MTATLTEVQKGDTVFTNLRFADKNNWSGHLGIPRTVVKIRTKPASRYSSAETLYYFEKSGGQSYTRSSLTHIKDLTPEQIEQIDALARKVAREQDAQRKAETEAREFERTVRTAFADKLAADTEILSGPTFDNGRDGGGFVGFVIRYWVVSGNGLDTVVKQREERVGVDVRRDHGTDSVTGKRVYEWGIGFGGTTYDQHTASLIAQSIQFALTSVIPTLGDARPEYDRD